MEEASGLDVVQTQLSDVLHVVSQALLVPVIILLVLFIAYALFCIGSLIYEGVRERRDFKDLMPRFLDDLMEAEDEALPGVIKDSSLLNRQKIALLKVYDYRRLPGDAIVALVRRLVNKEETHYKRIVNRQNMAAKISPMVGLMGTLIPLGPGIVAMGTGETEALSSALLVAFDTTVAGLITAAICLACGKVRQTWYNDYLSALDSSMATLLEKIETMREDGELEGIEPSDFAQRFEEGLAREKASGQGAQAADQSEGQAAEEAAGQAEDQVEAQAAEEAAGQAKNQLEAQAADQAAGQRADIASFAPEASKAETPAQAQGQGQGDDRDV